MVELLKEIFNIFELSFTIIRADNYCKMHTTGVCEKTKSEDIYSEKKWRRRWML